MNEKQLREAREAILRSVVDHVELLDRSGFFPHEACESVRNELISSMEPTKEKK